MTGKLAALFIDDSRVFCNAAVEAFRPYAHLIELTVVNNRDLALRMIKQYRQGYDLIILDACLDPPGVELDTLDLVALLFDTSEVGAYTGLLVGATGIKEYQREMIRAGCHHAFGKERILDHIEDLLSLAKERELNARLDQSLKSKKT